jgi:nonsense-mediated mRNA decay protein 3
MVQLDVTVAEVNSTTFWRYPFDCICNPKQLTEYIIMDIDLILNKDRKTFPGQGAISNKVFKYGNST